MHKVIYVLVVSTIFLSTILCILAGLDVSVSKKYEVDEGHIFLDMNKSLSPAQKRQAETELDAKGIELERTFFLLCLGAALSLIGGSTLLIYRRKILIRHAKV